MEIVFEVTDGGSSDAIAARKAVDDLEKNRVVVKAFQIGRVAPEERKIFNDVWNENREEKLGEIIGAKIANLLPAVTNALKKYLSGVRL